MIRVRSQTDAENHHTNFFDDFFGVVCQREITLTYGKINYCYVIINMQTELEINKIRGNLLFSNNMKADGQTNIYVCPYCKESMDHIRVDNNITLGPNRI